MPAARDLKRPSRSGESFGYPVKAGVRFFGRGLVALTAMGLAVPAGHAEAVVVVGSAELHLDNRDGADGDLHVNALRDVRGFEFTATPADIGKPVYAVDDETITLDDTGGRLKAGVVVGLGDGLTWVAVGN